LIANNYKKRDATAEHVENNANRIYCLPAFAAHSIDNLINKEKKKPSEKALILLKGGRKAATTVLKIC
jgi:hypothetical protein